MKIGVSIAHPSIPYDENYFHSLSEAGIDAIEIIRYAEDYAGLDYKAIDKYSKQYGVELWSYHLPFYSGSSGMTVNLTTDDKEVREKTFDCYTEIIAKAADIGIDKFIVHPCNESIVDEYRGEHLERARESLDRLAEIAARYGSVIAVENLISSLLGRTMEEMEMLIGVNEKLRVCFDTNHLLTGSHVEFIERFADRLITLHVSDFDFKWERHWLPGEGDIDWVEFKNALDRAGYKGVWIYEVSHIAPDTIVRERPLEYRDYVENARCIFAGKAPAPFGQRK